MELAAFSDRGIGTRERLEDFAANRIVTTPGGLQLQLVMVCDGAGGGEAGEMAARLTSRTIFEYLEISPEKSIPRLLIKAVEQANKAVYSELRGTGTSTVALAAVHLNDESAPYGRLYIASLGNSRLYLMRAGHLARLNIDHTLQNEYVFAGQMSAEEAKQLEDPEYVTRAIGIGAQVSVDIGFYVERGKNFVNSRRAFRIGQKGMVLQEGDTVFAASDGLFPYVNDEEFLTHALDDDVERATRTLLKYAADRGPEDNTALSMLFVPSRNRKMVQTGPRLSGKQRAGIAVFLLAIILLIGFLGIQAAAGANQQVAFIANQTLVQQLIMESSYTPTPTPLPPTATPTQPIIIGQVGNRYSVSQPAALPVFTGRFIDPLNPGEINFVSVAGLNVLSSGETNNPANLFLQPETSLRLNQVIDTPGKEHIDMVLGHNGDLFVNMGDYSNGGISIALEQNTDITIDSTSSCLSARQIPADASKPTDTDKVILACYGGSAGSCGYHLPGADAASVAPGQQALLDITNAKLISTSPITQADVDGYRQTIWTLTQNPAQLNCLSNWLDEDKDGINYPLDLCPTDFGSVAAQGCPDKDSDGVPDTADQCPVDIGPASNNGCPLPDVDGDNLAGADDACPFDAGPVSNQGCPIEGEVATQHAATQTALAFLPTDTPTPTNTPEASPTATATSTATPTPTQTPIPKPDAIDDTYSTLGGEALTISAPGLMSNDKPNGGTVGNFSGLTTRNGAISVNSDGSFSYTPPLNYVGIDNFSYTLTNTAGSDSATVTINVLKPPSPPPVASFTLSPSSGPAPLNVTFTNTSTGPFNTSNWDFNNDGVTDSTLTNPQNTFNASGTYTVKLTVVGPGGSSSASQTVTVVTPPVAVNDGGYTVAEDGALNVAASGVLTNDTYANKSALVAVAISNPAHGTLALNANGGFTYTPNANYNGPDSFTYQARDGAVSSNTATVNITVTSVNDAPVANADTYNTAFNKTLTIAAPGVLANDTDIDGPGLAATKLTNPAHGTVTVAANGSFVYTPTAGYSGTDSFTYQANDTITNSNITTVTIVIGTNTAPVANPNSYTMNEGTTLTIALVAQGVLANDTDIDGDPLTAVFVSGPTNGTLTLNANGTFSYTPTGNFNGAATFVYHARDGALNSNDVTVTISVLPVNDAPVAVDDNGSAVPINEDTPIVAAAPGVLGNDTDVDGDTLTAAVVTNPTHGTLILNADGSLTYTPDLNYNGTDSFTYRANDGTANSNIATVTIAIAPVNDIPIAVNDAYTMAPMTTLTVGAAAGVRANDSDIETATNMLTFAVVATTTNGTLTLNANGGFSYTPNAAFVGTDTFTYQANDGAANSNIATVTIAVGVNTAPVAKDDNYTTPLDTPRVVLTAGAGVLANDTDLDPADTLTAALIAGPTNGTLTVPLAANGTFTYTPNVGFTGTDTFTYQANDGTVNSNTATVTITVGVTNTAPVAVNDNGAVYTTIQDTPLNIVAPGVLSNDTDVDGDPLTAAVVTNPTNGFVLFNLDGSFTYVPNLGYNGTDTFTYQANDGTVNSNTATVTITITAPPVPPTANDNTYTTNFGTPLNVPLATGVLGNDTPATGLTAVLVSGPFSFGGGTITLNANGSFAYVPPPFFFGQDIFLYQATDGVQFSNIAAVFINVGTVSIPPTANDDAGYGTPVNTALNITTFATGVLNNDTDVNGTNTTLTAFLVSNPGNGVLTLNADGTFTYTPANGFIGIDTFTYQVSDGFLFSNVATVTINVGSSQPPVANDDVYTTPINTPLTPAAPGVLVNDTDAENDPLTAVFPSAPANGTVALNADGSFTYTPNAGFTGVDTFTYQANDGTSSSNIATVTVNIGVNTPPVANGDIYTTSTNKTLTVTAPGVLGNDTDIDGDLITVNIATLTLPTHGTLTLNADGSFVYVPTAGFKGTDSFTYQANDGTANSTTTATVTISVGSTVHTVAIGIPAPPPATRCTDTNFENPGMIRSHFLDDIDRANLFCRLIAAGGSYMYWFGSPITNAGNVGAQNVLDLGLVAAVDVFSTTDATGFVNDVDICLKGTGYIIYMNRLGQPRVPQLWSAWTTDAFPGYTCTTLYAPGTVILVANKPK